jgi:tetratricopeptide (TPR) repeat protein
MCALGLEPTDMADSDACARCGGPLVDAHCQACERKSESTFVHREIVVLVVLSTLVAVGFVLTRAAAGANRAHRLRDAAAWYDAGERYLAGGQPEPAIRALRRATAIDRDSRTYRLALAGGLAADRQDDAARQVLLGVRESSPEDPEVNVRLARLEARHDDVTGTVRYYQNAVYGSWGGDQGDARRQVRIEMIRYLLAHQQRGRALSELLVLSGNLPDDVQSQTEAGQLFLEAGDPPRGLDRFRQALRIDPKNPAALAGAGEAAFEVGDYASVQRYLRAVEPASSHLLELREVADLVLTRDPLRPGLALRQRQERVLAGLRRALAVLDDCANKQPANSRALESLRAEASELEPKLALERVRRTPESVDAGLNLIYRIEQRTAEMCGQGSAFDRALLLMGRRHDADRQ